VIVLVEVLVSFGDGGTYLVEACLELGENVCHGRRYRIRDDVEREVCGKVRLERRIKREGS
jgi:hypothetical protein